MDESIVEGSIDVSNTEDKLSGLDVLGTEVDYFFLLLGGSGSCGLSLIVSLES